MNRSHITLSLLVLMAGCATAPDFVAVVELDPGMTGLGGGSVQSSVRFFELPGGSEAGRVSTTHIPYVIAVPGSRGFLVASYTSSPFAGNPRTALTEYDPDHHAVVKRADSFVPMWDLSDPAKVTGVAITAGRKLLWMVTADQADVHVPRSLVAIDWTLRRIVWEYAFPHEVVAAETDPIGDGCLLILWHFDPPNLAVSRYVWLDAKGHDYPLDLGLPAGDLVQCVADADDDAYLLSRRGMLLKLSRADDNRAPIVTIVTPKIASAPGVRVPEHVELGNLFFNSVTRTLVVSLSSGTGNGEVSGICLIDPNRGMITKLIDLTEQVDFLWQFENRLYGFSTPRTLIQFDGSLREINRTELGRSDGMVVDVQIGH